MRFRLWLLTGFCFCLSGYEVAWAAAPGFSKQFFPGTVGPGSISTLTFTIDNTVAGNTLASNLAFTDNLPAGVTIATPANAVTNCANALLTAPAGGSTISFSGGRLGTNSTCSVSVDVTSSSVGSHVNTSGDLTSGAGNSGSATADLIVSATRPGFTKSFSASTVHIGQTSRLTLTIDNTSNDVPVTNLGFTDSLPADLQIAASPNSSNSCGGLLTANGGTTFLTLFGGFVAAGSSCSVALDVQATVAGEFDNTTGELTSGAGSSGKAGAVLIASQTGLSKQFTDDPVVPGQTATLQFSLTNFDRSNGTSNITFTDDLNATLSGLVAVGLPHSDVCGTGSTLSGTSLLTLSGGSLAAGGSCTFSVTVQVPAGATPGTYPNTTSTVSGDINGGGAFSAPAATDNLVVQFAPQLTKTFLDDPVSGGGTVTLEFSIANSDPANSMTDISFTDDMDAVLGGLTAVSLPAAGFCGAGSTLAVTTGFPPVGDHTLLMNGGSLAPASSCTFDVTLQLPSNVPGGNYPNLTSSITGTLSGNPVTGKAASDTLTVLAAPRLMKSFTNDPVIPGSVVTLQFTLTSGESAPASTTGITFSDDLDATLSGLVAVGLPVNDVCGAGSQISGSSVLTLSGASLAPAQSCTFSVPLQVPAGALPGSYPNTTSAVTGVQMGIAVNSSPASDTLQIGGLELTKSFLDDPVAIGGTVTLEFVLTNSSAVGATNISFTDDLNAALTGLSATNLPSIDVCGAGSQVSGTTALSFTGGSLPPLSSCTFDVTLQVPSGASSGEYTNRTSALTADIGGNPVTLPAATDRLIVRDPLSLTKMFLGDPALPGGTVTLRFTVHNDSTSQAATGVTFTDNLDAALPGLAAVGLPMSDVCGSGSTLSGTSLITLSGGSLPALGSCTFDVTLQVPSGVNLGTPVVNTTSQITGSVGGAATTGAAASDTLVLNFLNFSKSFAGTAAPGQSVDLTFTITNPDSSNGVSDLKFSDDLNAMLPGAAAVGLPLNDVCGAGSVFSGTSVLTLTGGSLAAGGTCTITVPVQIPGGASAGSYDNSTGDLNAAGGMAAGPASASLLVDTIPLFSKSFSPSSTQPGEASRLTFTIDHGAGQAPATGLAFTDTLPGGMQVATPPNASNGCGGTLTAAAGSTTISLLGGTLPAGQSCTIQVDVVSFKTGDLLNQAILTSGLGTSPQASATLTVGGSPVDIPLLDPRFLALYIALIAAFALWRLRG